MAAAAFLGSLISPTVPTVRPALSVAGLRQERPAPIIGIERKSVGLFDKIACALAVAAIARRASSRYKRNVAKHGPWWRPAEFTSSDDFMRIGSPMETTWTLPSNAQTVHLPFGAPPRPSTGSVQTMSVHRSTQSHLGSKIRSSSPPGAPAAKSWPASWVSAAAGVRVPKTLPPPVTSVAHGSAQVGTVLAAARAITPKKFSTPVGMAPAMMARKPLSRVASDPMLVPFPVSNASGARVQIPSRHEVQKQSQQSASVRSSSNGASPRAIDELEIIGIRVRKSVN